MSSQMISTPDDSNSTPATLDPVSSSVTKLFAHFDEVQYELLNVKNIIIKNLQEEN